MRAGENNIAVVEIEIDDICVLVGMEFTIELEISLNGGVPVLQKKTVRVSAVDGMIEGLYFIEGGKVAVSEGAREGVVVWFGQYETRLLLNHLSSFV